MPIPTTAVTLRVIAPDGTPVVGATLFALLSAPDVYQGVEVPSRVMGKTNDSGDVALSVFPNSLGTQSTTYTFVVQHKSFQSVVYSGVVVPRSAAVSLESLLGGQGPVSNYVSGALVLDGLQTYLNGMPVVLV